MHSLPTHLTLIPGCSALSEGERLNLGMMPRHRAKETLLASLWKIFLICFLSALEQFLTLRGHPVAACSSEDIRPAQRDSDSAPKRLTLVGIASSSYGAVSLCCSKFVLQGPQGFQLSFQFQRELSIFSATEIALHSFTFSPLSSQRKRLQTDCTKAEMLLSMLCIQGGRGTWVLKTCLCPAKFKTSWQ